MKTISSHLKYNVLILAFFEFSNSTKIVYWIPTQAFEARRHFFNDEEVGYFKTQDKKGPVKNPISGLSFMQIIKSAQSIV